MHSSATFLNLKRIEAGEERGDEAGRFEATGRLERREKAEESGWRREA